MKEIPLTQGKVALVDDVDYERVSALKWSAAPNRVNGKIYSWYAFRGGSKNTERVKLHRFILGLKKSDPHVDHKNGFGLDCQRHNLRLATRSQNARNRKPGANKLGFKGIIKSGPKARNVRYYPLIQINGKQRGGFGGYDTPEEAARAYDSLAIEHYGEFACPNFPEERTTA